MFLDMDIIKIQYDNPVTVQHHGNLHDDDSSDCGCYCVLGSILLFNDILGNNFPGECTFPQEIQKHYSFSQEAIEVIEQYCMIVTEENDRADFQRAWSVAGEMCEFIRREAGEIC